MAEAAAKLYTPSLLALSVELAAFPHDPGQPLQGRAKSRTCGSEVLLSGREADGKLQSLGLQVTACAVGQASAALFAEAAQGQSREQISHILDQLKSWLDDQTGSDFIPRLELLEAARDYPARHEAILLPWRAALDALA